MPKLQMSTLVMHHRQLLTSQFLKILLKDFGELMAMNLILVHWSLILDCVVRYGNMMLITEMKFEELTLMLPSGHFTQRVFTIDGFRNWKKVRNGKDCAFLNHIGKDPTSFHRVAEKSYEDLKNQSQHIQNVFEKLTSEQIANNQLQLKSSIDVVRVLAFQGVAFRGRDESVSSTNRGNFLEILGFTVSYNEQLAEVIAKAPKNATYTSPTVQKQIVHVFSTKVKEVIRNEIGDAKFCVIVDETRDESMKEQMAIVLRFVDKNSFVRKRFFGLVHVSDTVALTLKKSPACEVIVKIIDVGTSSSQRTEANSVHQLFCNKRNIDVPDMNAGYIERRGRACNQQVDFTIEHHYRVDIFCATIDSQLQELNHRFSEHAVELHILGSALDPRVARESFRIDDICQLVNKFYPQDFTDLEKEQLEIELHHYEHNIVQDSSFQELLNISELCQWLVRTGKSIIYQLVFRVVVLLLTLPVSTATTERAFSAMNIIKTRLRNKIEDEFLTDSLMLYIEKEIAATLSPDSIIDAFRDMQTRRVPF
ncbi:uncharacterized protein LOC132187841 [Corylus avellana]|uniref:uncharacterized protein LOC132187841 n=1 Tax=Corylus avellana TaxID=13451 RepID=UPI00286B3A9C|nr:uncharacterized protein LOC132187841 [Corylus avellana]